MSSRAVRKALKRLEAQKEMDLSPEKEDVQEEEDDEEEEDQVGSRPSNPFAMLNEVEQDEEDDTTIIPVPSLEPVEKEATAGEPTQPKKSKKKKKKKPAKDKSPAISTPLETPSRTTGPDLDEVDRAIQEVSDKYRGTPSPSSASRTMSRKSSILGVSPKYLDADYEMRKLFGKIVDAEAKESRRQGVLGVPPRLMNRIRAIQPQRKQTLIKAKDEWQVFATLHKQTLSMEIIEKIDGVTRFRFVHSRRYQQIQMQFFIAALGGDPNVLIELLRGNPFHVDSCIQISEMLKQQGNLSEAADLIERALFAFDCGLHAQFNVTLGTSRLPFECFENRSLYLTIWHQMESLGRRGCWRTCLEFNKLLFALEPEDNPYAALLAIDYPAIKSREYSYLIQLRDSVDFIDETGYLLNIHYSAALAEYMLEKDRKISHINSTAALSDAIKRFPWLIAQLYYALKLTFPPEFPTTVPTSPLQALYTDLYIHRSRDLWTVTEISSWLTSVVKKVASEVVQPPPPIPGAMPSTIPMNVARQLLVMNVPSLMSHIPREYTSVTQLASDPLPPPNSISPYGAPVPLFPTMTDENTRQRWIADLVRGAADANPARGEMGDDQDEDLEEEDDEVDGSSEDEEHNETMVSQLTNAFRNILGWFGAQRQENEVEEEEEEDEPGVD